MYFLFQDFTIPEVPQMKIQFQQPLLTPEANNEHVISAILISGILLRSKKVQVLRKLNFLGTVSAPPPPSCI
jgi:hypothetical protein